MQRRTQPVRVAVVGETRVYCEGVAHVLLATERLDVVAVLRPGINDLARLAACSPEVVLVDLSLETGPGRVQAVLRHAPQAKVIALGTTGAEDDLVALAEAGAVGYVDRDASVDHLIAIVESVASGEALWSPKMVAALLRRLAALAKTRRPATEPGLTARESEVLDLVDRGLSNKQIASRLSIEVSTVKNHVHNILDKLHVARRAEAAALMRGHHEAGRT